MEATKVAKTGTSKVVVVEETGIRIRINHGSTLLVNNNSWVNKSSLVSSNSLVINNSNNSIHTNNSLVNQGNSNNRLNNLANSSLANPQTKLVRLDSQTIRQLGQHIISSCTSSRLR